MKKIILFILLIPALSFSQGKFGRDLGYRPSPSVSGFHYLDSLYARAALINQLDFGWARGDSLWFDVAKLKGFYATAGWLGKITGSMDTLLVDGILGVDTIYTNLKAPSLTPLNTTGQFGWWKKTAPNTGLITPATATDTVLVSKVRVNDSTIVFKGGGSDYYISGGHNLGISIGYQHPTTSVRSYDLSYNNQGNAYLIIPNAGLFGFGNATTGNALPQASFNYDAAGIIAQRRTRTEGAGAHYAQYLREYGAYASTSNMSYLSMGSDSLTAQILTSATGRPTPRLILGTKNTTAITIDTTQVTTINTLKINSVGNQIDSAKVVTGSLSFYVGGTEYEAPHLVHGEATFADSALTIDLTQNVYSKVSNATRNLWTTQEMEHITFAGDSLTVGSGYGGDYYAIFMVSFAGASNDDFNFAITKNGAIVRKMRKSGTGTSNREFIAVQYYGTLTDGDDLALKVTNVTNNGDIIVYDGSVYIEKKHN